MNRHFDFSIDDVRAAAVRIASHVSRTPVLTSQSLDSLAGGSLFFKCENFQKAGAFKARGATNAVFTLDEAGAANGVATHSSGNHGAALARAARLRGIACHVVVPEGANPVKHAAIAREGANVIACEPTMAGRESALHEIVARTGARVIHPYADAAVAAGQGTVALELFDDVPQLDVLIVPVGGGGLISGCATVAKTLRPDVRVVGVEPEGAADALESFRTGSVVPVDNPQTIADGLRATIGEPNLETIRRHVDDIVTVSESEIVEAMRLAWERLKIVVEPSAAVGLAAAIHRLDLEGARTGVVLTGGNADLDSLPWL